jgi:hypothetical protein
MSPQTRTPAEYVRLEIDFGIDVSHGTGDWTPLLAPTMLQCESTNSVFQRCHSMSHCEQANYDAKLLAEKNRVLFEFN